MTRFRVGRHLGRTVYDGDELIGLMDTVELGLLVAAALNCFLQGSDCTCRSHVPAEILEQFPAGARIRFWPGVRENWADSYQAETVGDVWRHPHHGKLVVRVRYIDRDGHSTDTAAVSNIERWSEMPNA